MDSGGSQSRENDGDREPKASSSPGVKRGNGGVQRHLLRCLLSANEYDTVHRLVGQRVRPELQDKIPSTVSFRTILAQREGESEGQLYNTAALRASLRLFVLSYTGLATWDGAVALLARIRGGSVDRPSQKTSLFKSPRVRISLSISSILFLHRILFRFFRLLRENLSDQEAQSFRRRNPRTARVLTSKLTPAVGASLAGIALGLCPADQLRVTVAIYALSRAAEFSYNRLENKGWFTKRPWWFGSWLLFPFASGQLLHAFVFDRDCFPKAFGDFILKNSDGYVQKRPLDLPPSMPWPDTYDVVDSLATAAKLKYPPFISPILFPDMKTLPDTLGHIGPLTSPAHPAISNLTCAMLHPSDPSCLRAYITYYIRAFPSVARFFTYILAALSLARWRAFTKTPVAEVDRLSRSILRLSLFVTGSVGTSWGMICFLQQLLPRTALATQRFFVGGFVGGLWAYVASGSGAASGRGNFMYASRLSVDSAWKVAVKRGYVKGVKNGDVLLFVAALGVINYVYARDPEAVSSGVLRRLLNGAQNRGWKGTVNGDGDADGDDETKSD